MTKRVPPYSPEVRARAVRMVLDHQSEHPSQWSAINSIAEKIGCSGETLRHWVRQSERDQGLRPGATTDERERINALERENRELRQANKILRKASAYFAQGGARPPVQAMIDFIDEHRAITGASRSGWSCRSPRRRIMPTPPAAPMRASCRHGFTAMPRLDEGEVVVEVCATASPKLRVSIAAAIN